MADETKTLIDGPGFHCAKHDKPFVTTNTAEWQQHILADNEKGEFHTYSGSAKCMMCGNMKEFKREPVAANYFCLDCKGKIVQQIEKQQQQAQQQSQQSKSKEVKSKK